MTDFFTGLFFYALGIIIGRSWQKAFVEKILSHLEDDVAESHDVAEAVDLVHIAKHFLS